MTSDTSAEQARASKTMVNTRGESFIGCGVVAIVGAIALAAVVGGSSLLTLVAIVVAIAGVGALIAGISESRRWGPLECTVPEWPMHLGETQRLRLTRHAKRNARSRTVQVTGELICQEKVTYQEGTDTVTDKHIVHRSPISVTGELANNLFHVELPLTIPLTEGAPTLSLDNNEVIWRVELELGELSALMSDVAFDLQVAPVLSRSTSSIQDAQR